MAEMKEIGFNSVKTADTNVSIAVRRTLKITDEKTLVAYFKENKLDKEYVSERPNQYANEFLNQKAKLGEVVGGTELQETEYVSVRPVTKFVKPEGKSLPEEQPF